MMGIKKIEIRMYGDEEVFTRPDVTMGICNELEESVKKSFPVWAGELFLCPHGRERAGDPAQAGSALAEEAESVKLPPLRRGRESTRTIQVPRSNNRFQR